MQSTKSDKEAKQSDEDILKVAKERFNLAAQAEVDIRRDALEDIKFGAGEQWPEDVKRSREQDARPCLTINRLPQFIRQLTNDQRQNRPAIKVSPVDDNADIETAKIIQGMLRHIENSSGAETAYDVAFDSAVRGGFGYFRIVTDYESPTSFNQVIKFKQVKDRFSVYLDPSYQEPDGSDANWGFIFEDMSADDFKARYPKAELSAMDDWSSLGSKTPIWLTDKSARVAEYFYKEWQEAEICLLDNGQTVEKSKLSNLNAALNVHIVDTRKTLLPKIHWLKINAIEVLERTEWKGRWIPIIPVLGEEIIIEGRRQLAGVIRHAKDSQRMYNYWKSSQTETIALAPRAPFVAPAGSFAGFEAQWKQANVKNFAFLEYNTKLIGGEPAPPPQRNVYEPPVQAINQASSEAAEDLKATTGIYDAALGNRSNENSGIAIQRRNQQSQTSNFHFIDNLHKSIRHGGRICVDLIPHIYDTPRASRILGDDGTEEIALLNQVFNKGGQDMMYDLGVGQYDVTIDSGPSFETKRQEAAAAQSDLVRAYPQLMQMAGDIIINNMDWPGAKAIAERIKKSLPPNLTDDKNKSQDIPPQVSQQMQQMDQMIQQLTEQLKHKTEQIETKAVELESRERIEMAKIERDYEIALAQLGSKDAQALLMAEITGIKHRLELVKFNQPIESDFDDGAGQPQPAAMPESNEEAQQQPPTGGQPSPGQPMGV